MERGGQESDHGNSDHGCTFELILGGRMTLSHRLLDAGHAQAVLNSSSVFTHAPPTRALQAHLGHRFPDGSVSSCFEDATAMLHAQGMFSGRARGSRMQSQNRSRLCVTFSPVDPHAEFEAYNPKMTKIEALKEP